MGSKKRIVRDGWVSFYFTSEPRVITVWSTTENTETTAFKLMSVFHNFWVANVSWWGLKLTTVSISCLFFPTTSHLLSSGRWQARHDCVNIIEWPCRKTPLEMMSPEPEDGAWGWRGSKCHCPGRSKHPQGYRKLQSRQTKLWSQRRKLNPLSASQNYANQWCRSARC